MRVDQAPFKDKRVRQAVAYCIDRAALVKSLFNGAATVANDHSFAPVYVDTELANIGYPATNAGSCQGQGPARRSGR